MIWSSIYKRSSVLIFYTAQYFFSLVSLMCWGGVARGKMGEISTSLYACHFLNSMLAGSVINKMIKMKYSFVRLYVHVENSNA